MADNTIITQTPRPQMGGKPTIRFERSDFDATIWNKGYDVYHDRALRCPCKEEGADNLSSCKNCGGLGWFWINRNQTKMILQSMNHETQFKEWSEEHRGMVRITAMEEDRLAFMDRLTILNAEAIYQETVYPKIFSGALFVYTAYEILEMLEVFLFQGADQPLKLLIEGTDYTIEADKGKIILDPIYHQLINPKITVRYKHRPVYYVIDLVRGTMYSEIWNKTKIEGFENVRFPASAVGKLAHYTLEPKNFDGNYLFDNSYRQIICKLP